MTRKHNNVVNITALLVAILISGCATTSNYDISKEHVVMQAATISNSKQINYVEIPSHGASGDSLAIAVKGGGNATALRKTLVDLSDKGGGGIVVTSTNPALAKAVIEGAIKDQRHGFTNVILIYAGHPDLSVKLKPVVLASGMEYGFIDITKTEK